MANRSGLSTFILIIIAIFFELNPSPFTLATNDDVTNDEKIGIYRRVAVHICNRLPGEFLQTHCMSGDHDFGIHSVVINGCDTWNFRPNFLGTTVYLCAIGSPRHGSLRFNIYETKRDSAERCTTNCFWYIDAAGAHGINQKTRKEDISYAFF